LYSALALPLLFACSSENFDEKVISNDQFAGIEKVDATFSMEGETRFDGKDATGEAAWKAQQNDLWGFAWLGDGTKINPATEGIAYQNHNLIQKDNYFEPQTSIYVGKYFIYRPYDETTVSPQAINFNTLVDQPLAEGYESAKQPWKDLAKTAINIGDKWTDVIPGGRTYGTDPTVYDKPGIKQLYKLYAALFSNQTGLDLKYLKNNPTFKAAKRIQGATDIDYTYAAGTAVGSADIYEVTVQLAGAANSFKYAPKAEPNAGDHTGTYWADKDGTAEVTAAKGFTFNPVAPVTLTPADATNGLSTGANESQAWFWFNSLPVTAGDGALGTNVQTKLTTSYGVITINKTIEQCAYVFDKYDGTGSNEWIKLVSTADKATSTPKEWNFAGKNTFVNQYGNHKGKYKFDVDFSDGVMNNMDIKNDAHLQKLLKYYIASNKDNEANVVLNLLPASATDNTFKISKLSIALLQTINAGATSVKVDATGLDKVIVTQDGQTELGLADKTEVPNLDKVFDATVPAAVSLAAKNTDGTDITWTWKERTAPAANVVTVDAGVASLTNEGTLTVNATNIELSPAKLLTNAAGATMKITQVTTVKSALTNLGIINVGEDGKTTPELRAYGVEIKNDASALGVGGTINNYGVVGVSAGVGGGSFNNYGVIDMKSDEAITLLTANATAADAFNAAWAGGNKMGTVKLPNGNPTALVSVSNATNTGFIKYEWPAETTTYATPAGNVKYNTIIVSGDIKFTAVEDEIKYIEFNGKRTQVINPSTADKLTQLKGVIINAGKSIIIEMTNILDPEYGAFLGTGATVYKGGIFTKDGAEFGPGDVVNYLGTWNTNQIVKY